LIQDFSGKRPDFSAKRKIFLQIHRNTPESSKVHPTPTSPMSDRDLFYPKNVTILITTQRFGGVRAPEGREKVSDHIFLQNKKKSRFVFLVEHYG
jgi:hypothetical protein